MTSRRRPMGVVQSRLFLRFFVHTQKEGPFFFGSFFAVVVCLVFYSHFFPLLFFTRTKSQRQKKKKKKPKKKEEEEEEEVTIPSFAVFEKALVFENNTFLFDLSFPPF